MRRPVSSRAETLRSNCKRILVWHPVGDPQQMPIVRGVSDYAREQGWVLQANPEMFNLGLHDLNGCPADGLIATLKTNAEMAGAKALKIPVVNLSGALRESEVPRVMVDQVAMGRMAAEHFIACGLSRFAYYGERETWYSQQRREGFVQRLAEDGYEASVLDLSTRFGRRNPWYKWLEPVDNWIKSLRPPVGLLAVHDYMAAVLVDACLRLGRRVPDDIAVIGIGNDTITCEFCEVPLTSIARSNRDVGYQAAALLDRLMDGAKTPKTDILLPPEGVVRRRSTEVLVVEDRYVQAAVEYIQEHAAERMCVESLCQELSISHRLLDLRFQKHLGCPPREYLCRTRVERARQLLAASENAKLQHVAKACGFTGVRHLRAAFKRVTGMTPADYRRHSV
jgi:LacI family transcriptional regulator